MVVLSMGIEHNESCVMNQLSKFSLIPDFLSAKRHMSRSSKCDDIFHGVSRDSKIYDPRDFLINNGILTKKGTEGNPALHQLKNL